MPPSWSDAIDLDLSSGSSGVPMTELAAAVEQAKRGEGVCTLDLRQLVNNRPTDGLLAHDCARLLDMVYPEADRLGIPRTTLVEAIRQGLQHYGPCADAVAVCSGFLVKQGLATIPLDQRKVWGDEPVSYKFPWSAVFWWLGGIVAAVIGFFTFVFYMEHRQMKQDKAQWNRPAPQPESPLALPAPTPSEPATVELTSRSPIEEINEIVAQFTALLTEPEQKERHANDNQVRPIGA
jgi:hypothetical protein